MLLIVYGGQIQKTQNKITPCAELITVGETYFEAHFKLLVFLCTNKFRDRGVLC